MLLGDGSFGEVLLHQLVFAFGDQFDQRLVGGFGGMGEGGGDFSDLAAAVAIGGVQEGLHGDQVDDSLEAVGIGDGELDRDAIAAPALVQIVNEGREAISAAGFGVVHLVDDHDARHAGFFSESPHALGDGLHAVLRVDYDRGGLDRQQGGAGFMTEHVEAGSIDEVDLGALPFRKGDGVGHGGAAGYFFFVVSGNSRAIFDAALGRGHFGGMQQGGNQGGLAGVRMPHYSYVSDLTSLVRFHGFPRFGLELWRCGNRSPGPKTGDLGTRIRSPRDRKKSRGWGIGMWWWRSIANSGSFAALRRTALFPRCICRDGVGTPHSGIEGAGF